MTSCISNLTTCICYQAEKQGMSVQDVETGIIRSPGRRWFAGILSTVFLQALTMTFLAEWGDRSQIATIILAAREVSLQMNGSMEEHFNILSKSICKAYQL